DESAWICSTLPAVSTRIESFQKLMMAESVVFGSARRFEILTLSTGDAVKYGSSDAKSDVESTATGSWNSLRRRLVASLSRCGIVSRSRTESTMIGTVVVSPAFGDQLATRTVRGRGLIDLRRDDDALALPRRTHDRGAERHALRADGQPVRRAFHVTADVQRAVSRLDGGTHVKIAVRRSGVA